MTAILFDLGGTHLRAAVEFECSQVTARSLDHRWRCRIPNSINGGDPEIVWSDLVDLVCGYIAEVGKLAGAEAPVIFGFPGPIGPGGSILAAPTIVGGATEFPDFQGLIAKRTSRAVHMLNDMSAAAWWMSATASANRFLIITVSSGIGSKVFDRGSNLGVIDDLPFAGEIGHVTVDHSSDAPYCDCGGQGHLGAVSSARGIERSARREARRDIARFSESLCARRFGATVDGLNNEAHLVPAALAGDSWALKVIARCTAPLAQSIATITAATGLERVSVIGGFAQALGDLYRQILEEQLAPYEFFTGFPKFSHGFVEVHPAEDEVCLLGAAVYAYRRLGLP
jgi:glucokinase